MKIKGKILKTILTILILICIAILFPTTRELIISPILIPVKFELIKEEKNCIHDIDDNFDGVSVLGGDIIDGKFKGDFIYSYTSNSLSIDISCFFSDSILHDDEYSYFFTFNCKLKKSYRRLYDELILGKWPSAVMRYSADTNDNYLRLYRFKLKEYYWPKDKDMAARSLLIVPAEEEEETRYIAHGLYTALAKPPLGYAKFSWFTTPGAYQYSCQSSSTA